MDYARFDTDKRRAFLRDRLHALEQDHYANSLNLRVQKSQPKSEENDEALRQTKKNLATLEASIDVVTEELEAIPDDDADATP